MKHVIVLFTYILISGPVLHAENDQWIDGITIRIGQKLFYEKIGVGGKRLVDSEHDINKEEISLKDLKNPINIAFAETLMNSWSYRQMYFDYIPSKKLDDLPPSYPELDYDLKDASSKGLKSILITQEIDAKIFIKEKLFAGKDIQLDFINNNTNWAISVDTERTAIYLGYLWGVFIKTTETNRWLKTGIGIGTGYFKYKADLNLCSNYEVSIKEGTDVYHSGKCNGKTKFGEISVDGPVTTFAGNFVIFERKTPDSIWKIINANLSETFTNAKYEIENYNPIFDIKLQVIDIDFVSYTYRF